MLATYNTILDLKKANSLQRQLTVCALVCLCLQFRRIVLELLGIIHLNADGAIKVVGVDDPNEILAPSPSNLNLKYFLNPLVFKK